MAELQGKRLLVQDYWIPYHKKYHPFKDPTYQISSVPNTGFYSALNFCFFDDGEKFEYASILTSGYIYALQSDGSDSSDTFSCDITITSANPLITDNLELKEGNQTITIDRMKDTVYSHIKYTSKFNTLTKIKKNDILLVKN